MAPLPVLTAALALLAADVAAPPPPPPPAPAPSAPAILLVLDVAGADKDPAAHGLSDLLATSLLEKTSLTVTSASSVRDRLKAESDKVEAGCDSGECMAEVAGAIGARFVVLSHLTNANDVFLLRIEAFDEKLGKSVSVVTVRAQSVGAVYDEMGRAVAELIARSDGALPGREGSSPIVDAPGFFDKRSNVDFVWAGVLGGAGLVATVAYGYPTVIMASRNGDLNDAADAYVKEPSKGNATAVVDARKKVDAISGTQLLLSPAILVAIGGLGAGVVLAGLGVKEKLAE